MDIFSVSDGESSRNETHDSGNGSSGHNTEERVERLNDWMWMCTNCDEHAGMTLFIDACPGCDHIRCPECRFEKWRPSVAGQSKWYFSKGSPGNYPPSWLFEGTDQVYTSSSNRTGRPKAAAHQYIAPSAQENPSSPHPSSSKSLIDLSLSSITNRGVSQSTPLLHSSPASSCSSSGQLSTYSSGLFSPKVASTRSNTEIENDESEFDESDDEEHSARDVAVRNIMDILEEHLINILRSNLRIAVRLIPKIYRIIYSGITVLGVDSGPVYVQQASKAIRNLAVYTAQGASGSGQASNSTSCNFQNWTSNAQKRGRDTGGQSGQQRGDEPKKQKKDPNGDRGGDPRGEDPGKGNNDLGRLNFACHFYKSKPGKYGPWSSEKRYHICPCPTVPESRLDRIKDHFKSAHRFAECNRCYSIFKNQEELMSHQRLPEPCLPSASALKEGIDDGQWEKIENLLKKTRSRNDAGPPHGPMHDLEKWFEIWKILFPGAPPPSSPWTEPPADPRPFDVENTMDRFARRFEQSIQNGRLTLAREDFQHCMSLLREELQAEFGNSNSLDDNTPPASSQTSEPGDETMEESANQTEQGSSQESPGESPTQLFNNYTNSSPLREDESGLLPSCAEVDDFGLDMDQSQEFFDLFFESHFGTSEAAIDGLTQSHENDAIDSLQVLFHSASHPDIPMFADHEGLVPFLTSENEMPIEKYGPFKDTNSRKKALPGEIWE